MVFSPSERLGRLTGGRPIGVGIVKSLPIFILMFLFAAFRLGLSAPRELGQEKKELAAFEKEMAERPQEALSIARRAAATFADAEKMLYSSAVKEQEKHLAELNLSQVLDLAEAFEKKLVDHHAGRRIRINWLTARALGLTQDEVRRLLGLPQKSSFQIVYRRQIEQWVYDQPVPAWLTFSCSKGQIPRLQSVGTTFRD